MPEPNTYSTDGTEWLPMPIGKECQICKRQFPPDGLRDDQAICAECAPSYRALVKQEKRKNELQKKLGRFLASLSGDQKAASFMVEVYDELAHLYQGAKGLALEMKTQLDKAEDGSSTRINGLLGLLKYSQLAENSRKEQFDPSQFSDAQLEKIVAGFVAGLAPSEPANE